MRFPIPSDGSEDFTPNDIEEESFFPVYWKPKIFFRYIRTWVGIFLLAVTVWLMVLYTQATGSIFETHSQAGIGYRIGYIFTAVAAGWMFGKVIKKMRRKYFEDRDDSGDYELDPDVLKGLF